MVQREFSAGGLWSISYAFLKMVTLSIRLLVSVSPASGDNLSCWSTTTSPIWLYVRTVWTQPCGENCVDSTLRKHGVLLTGPSSSSLTLHPWRIRYACLLSGSVPLATATMHFPLFLCLVVTWSFSGYAIGNPDSLRSHMMSGKICVSCATVFL